MFIVIILFVADVKGPTAWALICLLLASVYVTMGSDTLRDVIRKDAYGVANVFALVLGCRTRLGAGYKVFAYPDATSITAHSLLYFLPLQRLL